VTAPDDPAPDDPAPDDPAPDDPAPDDPAPDDPAPAPDAPAPMSDERPVRRIGSDDRAARPEAGPDERPAPTSDDRHFRPIGSDDRAARPEVGSAERPAGGAGRRLGLVCLALVGGAGALEGAARVAWFTTGVDAVGRGTVPVTATGVDLLPGLSGLSLLALAAVAAAVALAGVPRRLLGGLIAMAGAYVGVATVRLLVTPPAPADLAALPAAPAGGRVAAAVSTGWGPLSALLGAALLLTAGIGLVAGEGRLPRFGARYAARPAVRAATTDPDRATWDALDAGRDPTADPPSRRTDGSAPGGPV
jgi:uncharacterized membrane protein (TIGR02234 family)